MKTIKSIIAIAALSFAAPASASVFYAPHERDEFCPAIERLATEIMMSRQAGVPMGTMMQIANRQVGRNKALNIALIMNAFNGPKYSTKEYQRKASIEFANAVMLSCYKDGVVQ